MSTTFEGYVTTLHIPSFRDVHEVSNRRLKEFLFNSGIESGNLGLVKYKHCGLDGKNIYRPKMLTY